MPPLQPPTPFSRTVSVFMLPLFVFYFIPALCVCFGPNPFEAAGTGTFFSAQTLCGFKPKPEPKTRTRNKKKNIYIYIYDDRRGEATKSRLLGALAFVVSQFWHLLTDHKSQGAQEPRLGCLAPPIIVYIYIYIFFFLFLVLVFGSGLGLKPHRV